METRADMVLQALAKGPMELDDIRRLGADVGGNAGFAVLSLLRFHCRAGRVESFIRTTWNGKTKRHRRLTYMITEKGEGK